MFEEYEKYLLITDKQIESFFEEQKPYIFCKEGCSYCCSCGQFPMSELEFEYLLSGYKKLDDSPKKIISSRIKKLKKNFSKNPAKKFEHCCPFLIGDKCSLYSYRPLICRTFGLIKSIKLANNEDAAIIPDCVHKNLNYANVYDAFNNSFLQDKIKEYESEPKVYNISLTALWNKKNGCSLEFGSHALMIQFLSKAVI